MKHETIALISYWLLFVIVPVGASLALLGLTGRTVVICVVVLLAALLIGERGFRRWKKLWHIA